MRIFAISDLHADYKVNAAWIENLSLSDYQQDVLILAGDVADRIEILAWCVSALAARFKKLLFVPGNHDLWVRREAAGKNSLHKFREVTQVVESAGASCRAYHGPGVTIIPMLGWYDYSFGEPSDELLSMWADFRTCRWPEGFGVGDVAAYFSGLNEGRPPGPLGTVITFSHFLPRIDLMPAYISARNRLLYPILGSSRLERQLRALGPQIHVYGHSHVNRCVRIDGVSYINNAFGYPQETAIAAKRLLCIHECGA